MPGIQSKQQENRIICTNVRLSYVHLFKMRVFPVDKKTGVAKPPRHETAVLIPKEDTQLVELIKAKIEAAKEKGKDSKWGGKIPPDSKLKLPLHDGDDEQDKEGYAGHWFFNCGSSDAPQVLDQNKRVLTDVNDVVSGDYVNISVDFFPFDNESKGVAVGLGNVQLVRKGEPLGFAKPKAEDEFETIAGEGADADPFS